MSKTKFNKNKHIIKQLLRYKKDFVMKNGSDLTYTVLRNANKKPLELPIELLNKKLESQQIKSTFTKPSPPPLRLQLPLYKRVINYVKSKI